MFYTPENFQKDLFLVFAKQFLGMKLKTYRRILRPFNRLNNPFGGFCDYLETSRQALDRLMMHRIDDNVGRAEHSRQSRIRIDGYTMVHVAVLNSLCRIFAREILPQAAAESDVEKLAPAADADNRKSPPTRRVQEPDVKIISGGVHRAEFGTSFFAVKSRVEILASGHDQNVKFSDQLVKLGVAAVARDDNRYMPGLGHGACIIGVDRYLGRFIALGKTLGNPNEQRPVGKNRTRRKYNQQNKRRKPHRTAP